MSGARILVVDDEPQILRFLRPALEASGYEVQHAGTGREALRMAANSAPDLIILDLGLPDMDGKDVLTQARQFTSAPIIILSARDREVEKIAALDLGADDYVEKPFAIGELLARLGGALRHARGAATQKTRVEVDGLVIDMDPRPAPRTRTTRNISGCSLASCAPRSSATLPPPRSSEPNRGLATASRKAPEPVPPWMPAVREHHACFSSMPRSRRSASSADYRELIFTVF